jgi:hypothetical protein
MPLRKIKVTFRSLIIVNEGAPVNLPADFSPAFFFGAGRKKTSCPSRTRRIIQDSPVKTVSIFCFHPKLSEYLGQTKESFGEKLYLWKCAKCGSEIWVRNVPKTGGATGTW